MKKYALSFLATVVVSGALAQDFSPGDKDGQVQGLKDGSFLAWDAGLLQWVTPDAFWVSFANRNKERGRSWPTSDEYPPYDEVNEHDTFLVQHDSGPCLMYFFHNRWRRANDVWRWGDAFNEHGGCPKVFE